jgi:hypothetical protein
LRRNFRHERTNIKPPGWAACVVQLAAYLALASRAAFASASL